MKRPLRRNRLGRLTGRALIYTLLSLGAIASFFPFAWMASTSFKTPAQALSLPISWIPRPFTLENYQSVWARFNFARYFINTVFIAVSVTGLSVVFCSLAGYAFAKKRFWGRELIFSLLLASMTIPGAVLMTPLFIIILKMGMLNRFLGIIIPFCVGVSNIFLMRQYISTIPSELEEAARMDGMGELAIWWRIIAPLSVPAAATVAIFSFVGAWDGFLWPLIVLKNKEMWTLNVALGLLQSEYIASEASPWGILMASSMVVALPLVAMFLVLQRYFMRGLVLGAVKG